jgi:hypothetical protein
MLLGTLTAQTFKSEVGNVFTADTVPKPINLQLTRLHEGKPTLKDFRVPFSLIFGTPRDTLLIEGFYDLRSQSGHQFKQIMLTPVISVGPYQEYQAIFN